MAEMVRLRALIAEIWGYRQLRPLQEKAMQAVLDGRDSLVVLPTSGGKSLCYQAPAVYLDGITVVISPLIALMKDQVDSLANLGVRALKFDSTMTSDDREVAYALIRSGEVRLIYTSPERMAVASFHRFLQSLPVQRFAVDEAHCISHWGHDFRTDYRNLTNLHTLFPGVSIQALTATATPHVRQDIIQQLQLKDPLVLVGDSDRPNLTYRVYPRQPAYLTQVREVLDRHPGQAGIVYCFSRRQVDELTGKLQQMGYNAVAYHAGMTAEERRFAQDQFIKERCDIVVATIAFGMGIDRSDIRFVLHTRMPKSIEAYQQETGRAGRDGLEAECVLLYHNSDYRMLRSLLEKPQGGRVPDPQYLTVQLRQLGDMFNYCCSQSCRHRALVEYFDQSYPHDNCCGCDICLGDREPEPDAKVKAQKMLSAVTRLKQHATIVNVLDLLTGQPSQALTAHHYQHLPTFGILRDQSPACLQDWLNQLIAQGALGREGELLVLNRRSIKILRDQASVRLLKPPRGKLLVSQAAAESWQGVNRELFERLRTLRRQIASDKQLVPSQIFSHATLREMARVRPSTVQYLVRLSGVSTRNAKEFGPAFVDCILSYSAQHRLQMDVGLGDATSATAPVVETNASASVGASGLSESVLELFRQQCPFHELVKRLNRSPSSIIDDLCRFIELERPSSIAAWVSDADYQRVRETVQSLGMDRLRSISLEMNHAVGYDTIRLVVTHLRVLSQSSDSDE